MRKKRKRSRMKSRPVTREDTTRQTAETPGTVPVQMQTKPGSISGAKWNGEPCEARCVLVEILGPEGEEFAEAVEIWDANQAGDQPFYIANDTGLGYMKVTAGGGSPNVGHRSIEPNRVVQEVDCAGEPEG